MDEVRVHYNSSRPAQLNALAYTKGKEIHIAPGQERHLPHETWHTVQQMQGRVQPTMQAKGMPINDDTGLETEADRMGTFAAAWRGRGLESAQEESVTQPGGGVAQRVRGGIEYTEDAPTQLDLHQAHAAPGPGGAPVNRSYLDTIGGAQVSIFRVPNVGVLGNRVNFDRTLFQSNQVKLTNDVRSAEWVIERHGADVPVAAMHTNLRNDIAHMFNLRGELADEVKFFGAVASLLGTPVVALVPGNVASLHLSPWVFVYRPEANKGKAQITVQYTAAEAIKRINLLNASKFRAGTKVAEGEDTARIAGTEGAALLAADAAGTTSFSSAQAMLTALENTSQAILQTVPPGAMLPAPLKLTVQQVGLIKLMVLNDAMATTTVRYNARLGQAQDKNVQRFFPKSRRDEYTRAVAAANLTPGEMASLRIEINRTAAADAQLAFNGANPGTLLVDETFNALGARHADMAGMLDARQKLVGVIPGAPAVADLNNIKTHVLGANGATVATWIARASQAYTDVSAFSAGNAGNPGHYQVGGAQPGNVIRSTQGFTPVAGGGHGAIYEMREREIAIDESGWFNVGSRADIEAGIAALFGAA